MMRPLVQRASVALLLVCAFGAWHSPLGAQSRLKVTVIAQVEQLPLPYAVVELPELGVERFTNSAGMIALPLERTGATRIRVRRIGFTPRDTVITVERTGAVEITVALTRVSYRLSEVRVVAWPPCREPGIPKRQADPLVVGILGQVQENAKQYRLLVEKYPFEYAMERQVGRKRPDGRIVADATDTTTIASRSEWRYRPGQIVRREMGRATSPWVMMLPTLLDLADRSFIESHCFHVAGLEEKEGHRLLRVDLVAAERIKSPDVNASLWLDPVGYQLRFASFTLTRIPSQFRELSEVTSETAFRELFESVPIIAAVDAEQTFREPRPRTLVSATAFTEKQRVVRVTFLGARPDDP